uniref:Secreted protein n=1 Tax=Achlya hypogyna TaxID=1202772 RepID=A0A0A7CNB2_ACHHY|nr:secreted protein [Achlya hypogyna]
MKTAFVAFAATAAVVAAADTTAPAAGTACTPTIITGALTPLLAGKDVADKCAKALGVEATALSTLTKLTTAQITTFATNEDCASYYSYMQKAYKGISPPCIVSADPLFTSTDAAAITLEQFATALKGAAANGTVAVPSTTTVAPKSGAPTTVASTTAAPAKSAAGATVATGLVTLAAVAIAAL